MDTARLERSYRRLLLAYPRTYRRHRGAEILTTLLEAARPGARRPGMREATDLVLGGVRRRVSPPRGPGFRLVAVAAALAGGLALSAAAGWLAWAASDTMPTEAQASAVAATALPGLPAGSPQRHDDPFHHDSLGMSTSPAEEGLGWAHPAPGKVETEYGGLASATASQALAGAQTRLADAGWRVGPAQSYAEGGSRFWATRHGLAVRIEGDYPPAAEAVGHVTIAVHRVAPARVTAAAVAGLVAGLAAGWSLAVWALRRYRRHTPRGRAAMVLLGVPSLVLAMSPVVFTAVSAVGLAVIGGWSPHDSLVAASTLHDQALLAAACAVGLLAAVVVAAGAPGINTMQSAQPASVSGFMARVAPGRVAKVSLVLMVLLVAAVLVLPI